MSNQSDMTQKAKAQLDKWDAQIAKAEAEMKEVEADSKVELQTRLEEMRVAREEASQRLSKLQSASADAWGDMSQGFMDAWGKIERSFEKASERFS